MPTVLLIADHLLQLSTSGEIPITSCVNKGGLVPSAHLKKPNKKKSNLWMTCKMQRHQRHDQLGKAQTTQQCVARTGRLLNIIFGPTTGLEPVAVQQPMVGGQLLGQSSSVGTPDRVTYDAKVIAA